MGPTSALFIAVACALACLTIAASVVCWQRLTGTGPAGVATRVLTQLLVALTSVLAAATLLNRQYDFYTTWTDVAHAVTGTVPTDGRQAHVGAVRRGTASGPAGSAGDRRIDRAADHKYAGLRRVTAARLRLRRNPGRTGQFVIVHVPGLGPGAGHGFRAGRVVVWLPPSYGDPRHATRTYPVIEAFHGIPGGPRDWARVDHLDQILARAIGAHALREAIVVMPDFAPAGLDTECVNGGGIPMETWLTKDVPRWVISHLRARATPRAWATLGYSAGGWCAAVTGLLHPHRYAADIVLGGYFRPQFTNWKPFAPGHVPARYDLQRTVARKPPASDVWIQVSTADPTSGPQSRRFVRAAHAPLSVTAFTQHDVGHRVDVYMAVLPRALAWLGSTLPAFAGARSGS